MMAMLILLLLSEYNLVHLCHHHPYNRVTPPTRIVSPQRVVKLEEHLWLKLLLILIQLLPQTKTHQMPIHHHRK